MDCMYFSNTFYTNYRSVVINFGEDFAEFLGMGTTFAYFHWLGNVVGGGIS